jgi:NB-ARC domain
VHLSNASSHSIGPTQGERSERTPNYAFGLNLAEAPQIDEALFVGREVELEELQEWLYSSKGRRKVVAVSGLGGIGKTQLSIHFAKRCQRRYSSVFWLNAKDESSLKTGLVNLAIRLADEGPSSSATVIDNEEQAVEQTRRWLSRPENNRWLVVYDNYDDPDILGMSSATGYGLR